VVFVVGAKVNTGPGSCYSSGGKESMLEMGIVWTLDSVVRSLGS
jgi:hypothetical protein